MRLVKIEDEADYKWLKTYIDNWNVKIKDNISAYVEHAEMFRRLGESFEAAEKVIDPMDDGPKEVKTRAPRGSKKDLNPNYCKDHATYGAKRPPRTECAGCWAAFKKFNPLNPALKRNPLSPYANKKGKA